MALIAGARFRQGLPRPGGGEGEARHRHDDLAHSRPQTGDRSRWRSRLTVLAILVVIGSYGLLGPGLGVAAVLGVVGVIPLVVRWRVSIGPGAQLWVALLSGALAVAIVTTAFVPPEPVPLGTLRLGWSAMAAVLLVIALGRLYWQAPKGGDAVTLAVGLFALGACGGTVAPPSYASAIVAFLVLALAAMRVADPGRAPWRGLSGRWLGAVGVSVAVAIGTVSLAMVVLPYGHRWVLRRIMQSASEQTGFTTNLALGELRGLLQSDEVVLRVRGEPTDYLRGVVFTRYRHGRWSAPRDLGLRTIETPTSLPAAGRTQIEIVEQHVERYFTPLDADIVAMPSGLAAVNEHGIYLPVAAEPTERFWVHRGSKRQEPIARPGAADLAVPDEIEPELQALALRWTAPVDDPARRLEILAERLQTDFRYSLSFTRQSGVDPILDFLERDRQGHCEYFASAMALLSRSLGIPARVVGGYRVVERNRLGGYAVVRQRHAHTWVEAWVPGKGWRPYDPTPAWELAADQPTSTPWASALYDLARAGWAQLLWWLDQRTPLEITSLLVLLILLAALTRWVNGLRRRRRQPTGPSSDPPLPCFERLSKALERHRLERAPHEPIEQLARVVSASALPRALAERARDLLEQYAALRYGGLGAKTELSAAMDELSRELERAAALLHRHENRCCFPDFA